MKLIRIFHDALLAPPDGQLLRRSLLNFVLTLAGSLALVGAALGLARLAGIPEELLGSREIRIGVWNFVGAVLIAPAIETILMAGGIALTPRSWGIVWRGVVSGLIWGGLHGMVAPIAFFGPGFAFFVFSCGYQVWRPISFRAAFIAAALPHALLNLTVLTTVASGR